MWAAEGEGECTWYKNLKFQYNFNGCFRDGAPTSGTLKYNDGSTSCGNFFNYSRFADPTHCGYEGDSNCIIRWINGNVFEGYIKLDNSRFVIGVGVFVRYKLLDFVLPSVLSNVVWYYLGDTRVSLRFVVGDCEVRNSPAVLSVNF